MAPHGPCNDSAVPVRPGVADRLCAILVDDLDLSVLYARYERGGRRKSPYEPHYADAIRYLRQPSQGAVGPLQAS